jgi:NAD(P)-dependent dehydrogenase (short-subunit alcohol dehydrogenase family)
LWAAPSRCCLPRKVPASSATIAGPGSHDWVADYASAGRMARQCAATFGKVDFLVNATGMLRGRMIWNMTEDDFDAVISVHLNGHWNMCHHATKMRRGARFARIVNFSSDAFKGSIGQWTS